MTRFWLAGSMALLVVGGMTPRAWADSGPATDVDAVRAVQMRGEPARRIPHLRVGPIEVERGFALVGWFGTYAGGETVYRRDARRGWVRITGGGGAYSANDLSRYGVPLPIARTLVADFLRDDKP